MEQCVIKNNVMTLPGVMAIRRHVDSPSPLAPHSSFPAPRSPLRAPDAYPVFLQYSLEAASAQLRESCVSLTRRAHRSMTLCDVRFDTVLFRGVTLPQAPTRVVQRETS